MHPGRHVPCSLSCSKEGHFRPNSADHRYVRDVRDGVQFVDADSDLKLIFLVIASVPFRPTDCVVRGAPIDFAWLGIRLVLRCEIREFILSSLCGTFSKLEAFIGLLDFQVFPVEACPRNPIGNFCLRLAFVTTACRHSRLPSGGSQPKKNLLHPPFLRREKLFWSQLPLLARSICGLRKDLRLLVISYSPFLNNLLIILWTYVALGAGGGLGRQLALEFSKHAVTLVLWDINKGTQQDVDNLWIRPPQFIDSKSITRISPYPGTKNSYSTPLYSLTGRASTTGADPWANPIACAQLPSLIAEHPVIFWLLVLECTVLQNNISKRLNPEVAGNSRVAPLGTFSSSSTKCLFAETNEDTAAMVRSLGRKVHTYVCDCCDREDVYRVAGLVKREVGDVGILVNNAGILKGKRLMRLKMKKYSAPWRSTSWPTSG